MTQITHKHHFISKFHLEKFTPSMGGHDLLWVFDLHTATWRQEKPKNVAWKWDRYILETDAGAPDALEKDFDRLIETPASSVVKSLCENPRVPTGNDLICVLRYVALLEARHPRSIDASSQFTADIGKIM